MNTKKILAFTIIAVMLASIVVLPVSDDSEAAEGNSTTINVDFSVSGDQTGVTIERIASASDLPSNASTALKNAMSGNFVAVKVTLDKNMIPAGKTADFRLAIITGGDVKYSVAAQAFNTSGVGSASFSFTGTDDSGVYYLTDMVKGQSSYNSTIKDLNNGGTAYAVLKFTDTASSVYAALDMVTYTGEKEGVSPISPLAEFAVHCGGTSNVIKSDVGSSLNGIKAEVITSVEDLPEELRSSLYSNTVAIKYTINGRTVDSADASKMVDFRIDYKTSSATNVLVNAVAKQGNTALMAENIIVSANGDKTAYVLDNYAYPGEGATNNLTVGNVLTKDGVAYAVINFLDGEKEATVCMVSYDSGSRGDAQEISPSVKITVGEAFIPTITTTPVDQSPVEVTIPIPTGKEVIQPRFSTSSGIDIVVSVPVASVPGASFDVSMQMDVTPTVPKLAQIQQNLGNVDNFVFDFSLKSGDTDVTEGVTLSFELPSYFIGKTNLKIGSVTDTGFESESGTITVNGSMATVTFNHYSSFVVYEGSSTPISPTPGPTPGDEEEEDNPIIVPPTSTTDKKKDNTSIVAVAAGAAAVAVLAVLVLVWARRN